MEYIDIIGSGFVPGVPGLYGNCRVYYEGETVLHVGPLYQAWSLAPQPATPAEEVPQPAAPAEEPAQPAQPEAQHDLSSLTNISITL